MLEEKATADRVAAFSDAVFAVIVTVMVLELRAPDQPTSLLPLLDPNQQEAVAVASEVLKEYPNAFERYWLAGMREKLGLQTAEAADLELVQSLQPELQPQRVGRPLHRHPRFRLRQNLRPPKHLCQFSGPNRSS